jgi:predicted AAA+ superfamily ATPase
LLVGLNVVTLSHYRIVGNYVRFGKTVCNALKDARQKIVAACRGSSPKRENYIIWAPPGSGKTYFVQEVAALLGDSIRYRELNLAKLDEAGFRSGLAELRNSQKPCLCFIDEADAKSDEPWPYDALLPFLDASVTEGARLVFVLAGSLGSSLEDMKKAIASRPKGSDVLSRIPSGNEYTIPPMGVGDRLLVVLSQFRQAGKQMGHEVREVEKLGLYYVAINPRLSNARQLREFAVRCAERVLPSDDRLKYDSLFHPGDRENKLFWTQAVQSADALVDSFLLVED